MDYTSAMAELLAGHGFRRFMMSRTEVGHLKLVGRIDGRPVDIVLDTGASKTFAELNYCRAEGIAVSDTGPLPAPWVPAFAGTSGREGEGGQLQTPADICHTRPRDGARREIGKLFGGCRAGTPPNRMPTSPSGRFETFAVVLAAP